MLTPVCFSGIVTSPDWPRCGGKWRRFPGATVVAAMRYQRMSAERNREIADRIGTRFDAALAAVPDPGGAVVPIRRPRKAAAR